jgi:hypothetical protein
MDLRTIAVWTRATGSSASGDNCVEVALNIGKVVAIRDSKHPSNPPIILRRAQWRRLRSKVQEA